MSKPNNIRIYYQDEYLVVIEKPAGFHVHTPESMIREGKSIWKNNISLLLKKQLSKEVYTVHRLDKATSGVMVFALSSEVARQMQDLFIRRLIKKTYICLVRGWVEGDGSISDPLTADLEDGPLVQAETSFSSIHRFSLNHSLGRYQQVRYTLLQVEPKTGRRHQIRRHFKKISHPLIGDTTHGDGKHNRLWRELIEPGKMVNGSLYLKAYSLSFLHPVTGEQIYFRTRWNKSWHRLFEICGFCPVLQHF